ncbi:MAG TPA: hypothetical protein DCE42_01340 [Myxococcales bacterium]|nr:hypothetical protein [Deltaproteobacteria bacterium]HAA53366.1 hypothetical protein [Myxococcales bacterium]|tara:strand:+ start:26237 stop:26653 length:417 start_codon:yes stop_codon:yes gene_type:complete
MESKKPPRSAFMQALEASQKRLRSLYVEALELYTEYERSTDKESSEPERREDERARPLRAVIGIVRNVIFEEHEKEFHYDVHDLDWLYSLLQERLREFRAIFFEGRGLSVPFLAKQGKSGGGNPPPVYDWLPIPEFDV